MLSVEHLDRFWPRVHLKIIQFDKAKEQCRKCSHVCVCDRVSVYLCVCVFACVYLHPGIYFGFLSISVVSVCGVGVQNAPPLSLPQIQGGAGALSSETWSGSVWTGIPVGTVRSTGYICPSATPLFKISKLQHGLAKHSSQSQELLLLPCQPFSH